MNASGDSRDGLVMLMYRTQLRRLAICDGSSGDGHVAGLGGTNDADCTASLVRICVPTLDPLAVIRLICERVSVARALEGESARLMYTRLDTLVGTRRFTLYQSYGKQPE